GDAPLRPPRYEPLPAPWPRSFELQGHPAPRPASCVSGSSSLDHLWYDEEAMGSDGRIGEDGFAIVFLRHNVLPQRLTALHHRGHRSYARGVKLIELLYPFEYLVELADQCLSLLRFHTDPCKLGDVSDRAEVDRHAAPIPIIRLRCPMTARTLSPCLGSDKTKRLGKERLPSQYRGARQSKVTKAIRVAKMPSMQIIKAQKMVSGSPE